MSNKIMRDLLLALPFFISIGCSTSQVKPGSVARQEGHFEVAKFVGDFKVKRTQLKNGLKLIIVEDDSSPTFSYQTWFDVGSRNEVPGKTGLAHLFEHLMFKGTTHHPDGEFDSLLERAGAEGENAFTSNDHTAYVQELPKEQLDLIVGLESDRMVHLIVNDQSFKTEREVVQNERRMSKENNPTGTLYQTLFETIFSDHPYHWPVIGYEQDLNIMNAQDARDFYERYYSPDRATIVIVGDVDADSALRKVEQAYGKIPAKNTPQSPIKPEPEQTAQRRKKISLQIENEKLWLAFRIPEASSPDAPIFDAIQALISDGRNSRLDRALVDAGISSSITSGSLGLHDAGVYVFSTDLQKGKLASIAESVILREIERLKTILVSDVELIRAKNLYRFHFLNQLSTSTGMSRFLGDAETQYGHFQKAVDFNQKVQEVTPAMIQDTVKKYFNTQNLTVLVGTQIK